jgi:hypothetical protein
VTLSIALAYAITHELVDAWWLLPVGVAALLGMSVLTAAAHAYVRRIEAQWAQVPADRSRTRICRTFGSASCERSDQLELCVTTFQHRHQQHTDSEDVHEQPDE